MYVRRFYRLRSLGEIEVAPVAGQRMAWTTYPLDDETVHLVVGYLPMGDLPLFARAVAEHLSTVPDEHRVVVDVVTWRTGERPQIDETAAQVSELANSCDFGRRLHRLDVTVTSTDGAGPEHFRTQHLTLRAAADGGYVEDVQYRNLHPMLAKRLSLWRLQNFDLQRLPSAEDVYLFLGVARENPKDRRLFALAEVRDLTSVPDPVSGRDTYPMLERVGLRALAAMRDALAGMTGRDRPVANRLVLYVRQPWTVPQRGWRALASAFAPLAVGVGLEKVVLRVRIPTGEHTAEGWEVSRESTLHVENLSGGGLTVTERPLGSQPDSPVVPLQPEGPAGSAFRGSLPLRDRSQVHPARGHRGRLPTGRLRRTGSERGRRAAGAGRS